MKISVYLMEKTMVLKCLIPLLLLNLFGFAQTASFSSNFEDQNTDAEIGSKFIELNKAIMRVVTNPHPDASNNSEYVLKHVLLSEGLQRRSEYTTSRMETNEKKYIYTWSIYQPVGMFTDVNPSYVALNQWKTWPCEAGPISNPDYQHFDTLICSGGGIFNDLFFYPEIETVEFRARAKPSCNSEYMDMPVGRWNKFVLEVYWTNSENGYYRIWRNDTLAGYKDNIKTLPDQFEEGTCNIYWSNGLYSSWWKTGNETTDSVIAYTDNIAIYDIDSAFTISSVCPDCESAPLVPTDSSVYKININGSRASNGYNNYILSWRSETNTTDLSSTFGQSNGLDLYLPTDNTSVNNSLSDECFPSQVISTSIQWTDTATNSINLKDLTPSNTYTFKLLCATINSSTSYGAQIWTTEENRDTVLAAFNTCDVAELTNLKSDENGNLTINVKSISDDNPRVYINSIEIVEYIESTNCDTTNISIEAIIQNEGGGQYDGSIDISVYGGSGPYTFLWNTGDNTEDINNLMAGNYSVLVTDVNGCSNSDEFSYSLPDNLFVSDSTITNGESSCFNAYNNITVAGDGSNVEIQSGGSVNFIAQQSISILPGFHAYEGSYSNSCITTDGSFCEELPSSLLSMQEISKKVATETHELTKNKIQEGEHLMKVFPNPNNGKFIIQLLNFTNGVQFSVYNSIGTQVHQLICSNEKSIIDLSNFKGGIYFVIASNNEAQLTQKVLIQ